MPIRLQTSGVCVVAILFVTWISLSISDAAKPRTENQSAGLAAWEKVYSVMISPRCLNCHTATNYPQQGDDRHRHVANVVRGPADIGVAGLNCQSCHQ